MCRYGNNYKPHFACFDCRKTFKRRLLKDVLRGYTNSSSAQSAKCPECNNLMADMGLDFKSPKKKDVKAWKYLETLYSVDITFYSCGCSGPGYVPENKEELIKHFLKIKNAYLEHQHFWARRKTDPESQSDIAKDRNKNFMFLSSIFNKGSKKKPKYDSENAQVYWNNKVIEVEEKINRIRKQC